MVDATASLGTPDSGRSVTPGGAADAGPFQAGVHTSPDIYRQLAQAALFAPSQDPDWIDCWTAHLAPQALFATVQRDGRPVFSVALEIQKSGPFTKARLMGGGHANGNFPPLSPESPESDDPACMQALRQAIQAARPDIDVLLFERLEPALQGRRNPLLALPHRRSPNIALAVDLTPGLEKVIDRAGGKRKRKRHRYQHRKFIQAGDIKLLRATDQQQVDTLLDVFFAIKSVRLQRLGVGDVFGDEATRSFFRALFGAAARQPKPAFFLDALEVAGKIRAITGSSVSHDRLICDFAAFAEDELAIASPGEYLLFENITAACRDGFRIYDLGVGDEPYKRSWCNLETQHYDVIVPLTSRGRLMAAWLNTKSGLKARIKESPLAWRLVKALRSRRATNSQDDEEPG